MTSKMVEITGEDIEFLRLAQVHYAIFAEASERQGESQVTGVMRKQEFYAERFLLRVTQSEGAGE